MKKVKSSNFLLFPRELLVFILILSFDFLSKYWVVHHLPLIQPYLGFPFGGIGILNTQFLKISIVHLTNTGTAWGLFANFQIPLLVLRLFITCGILGYLLFLKPPKHLRMPLFIIAAGAFGNIADFFLYGHVIDMIYFIFYKYSFPIFNIADSCIFCAISYLILFARGKSHAASH